MTDNDWPPDWAETEDETTYAQGRRPGRIYASRSFRITNPTSRDFGRSARFIYKVLDTEGESEAVYNGTEWLISETPRGRYQVKLLVAREAGNVKELWLQRVPAMGSPDRVKVLANFRRENAARLVDLLSNLDHIPVEGDHAVRVDDALVRDLFADPDSLIAL